MEVTAAFFAQTIRKTADGGGIDIIGIFDGITSESFPYWHPNIRVIIGYTLNWNDNGQYFNLTLRIIDEDGNKVIDDSHMKFTVDIPMADGEYRTDWTTGDFPKPLLFPKPGRYQCDILLDDRILKSTNIHFVLASKEPVISIDHACFGEVGQSANGPVPTNVFNSLEFAKFPNKVSGLLPVYIQATVPLSIGRSGKGVVSAQLFNSRTNKRVAGYNTMQLKPEGPAESDVPVQIAANLYLKDPQFQNPGRYEVRIVVDNEVLFRLPLEVRLKT